MKKSDSTKNKKPNRASKILVTCIKYYQAIWFIILVVVFSVFVFSGYNPGISFDALNAKNIIFCTWILLIFIPFIKIIDIAGVIKLVTREDEKTVEELKEAKEAMVTNVNLSITNSNTGQSMESEPNQNSYHVQEGD